ncbi:unnamed protein product [Dracunculus medinensis]|uniref:Uncharacterized protein n=1 Tax=Dracunculus medinensis TaxID=318479 RepID=A0A158Q5I6_DRAME|nr:unnamed protein product [Dracunculus medinensis]
MAMCNEIPKSVADSIGPSEFDEETWLIAPPSDVTSQNSGRILEWLQVHSERLIIKSFIQCCFLSRIMHDYAYSDTFSLTLRSMILNLQDLGADMNVDFQTRSALSRKLASHAAKKMFVIFVFSRFNVGASIAQWQEAFFRLLLFGSFHLLQHRTYLVLERKIEKLFASTPSSSSIHSVEDADQLLSHYSLQTLTSDSAAALNNSDMRRSMTLDVVFENDHVGNVENELDEEIMKENEVTSTSDDEFFDAISESSINDENPDQRISPSGEYETRSADKIRTASNLQTLAETSELSFSDTSEINGNKASTKFPPNDLLNLSARSTWPNNTAKVAPTIIKKQQQQLSSPFETPLKNAAKVNTPDLSDIQNIVHQQEIELWEEMRQRKSSLNSESGKTRSAMEKIMLNDNVKYAMASSRSVDFSTESPINSSSAPTNYHISRLPTPIRRTTRPVRSGLALTRISADHIALRGMAGGSTPSLAIPNHHSFDESLSEYGESARYGQHWSDECF